MQVGFDVFHFDQLRKFVRFRQRDLIASLAQFGRNPLQAQRFIHFLFGGAENIFAAFNFFE
ncbi:MAG: hypothetical protein U0V48_04405 [Anaerolineales bacterium]